MSATGKALAPDPARARRAHLLRAGIAASLVAVLAVWLPMNEEAPVGAEPPPPEAPGPVAAAAEPAAPIAAADPPTASAAGEGEPEEGSPAPAETAAATEGMAAAPAPGPGSPATPAAVEPASPAAETAAPPAEAAPAPMPQPGRGYMVQLGVFGDPENAERLRKELAAEGYSAYMQSRVVVGPFADRKAADAARVRLKGERKLDGVILPPRKP